MVLIRPEVIAGVPARHRVPSIRIATGAYCFKCRPKDLLWTTCHESVQSVVRPVQENQADAVR